MEQVLEQFAADDRLISQVRKLSNPDQAGRYAATQILCAIDDGFREFWRQRDKLGPDPSETAVEACMTALDEVVETAALLLENNVLTAIDKALSGPALGPDVTYVLFSIIHALLISMPLLPTAETIISYIPKLKLQRRFRLMMKPRFLALALRIASAPAAQLQAAHARRKRFAEESPRVLALQYLTTPSGLVLDVAPHQEPLSAQWETGLSELLPDDRFRDALWTALNSDSSDSPPADRLLLLAACVALLKLALGGEPKAGSHRLRRGIKGPRFNMQSLPGVTIPLSRALIAAAAAHLKSGFQDVTLNTLCPTLLDCVDLLIQPAVYSANGVPEDLPLSTPQGYPGSVAAIAAAWPPALASAHARMVLQAVYHVKLPGVLHHAWPCFGSPTLIAAVQLVGKDMVSLLVKVLTDRNPQDLMFGTHTARDYELVASLLSPPSSSSWPSQAKRSKPSFAIWTSALWSWGTSASRWQITGASSASRTAP